MPAIRRGGRRGWLRRGGWRLVERVLTSDNDLHGVCWRAIHTLAVSGHPFSGLLDAALARYGSAPDRKSELLDVAIGASQEADEIKGLRQQQIAAYEAAADTCAGALGKWVLDALLDRHGPDLQPMLVDCFGNAPAIRAEQAEQIAASFNHWASGDSAVAGSVMAGVVEPLVRGVCRQLAINVTRTDGRVRTLRSLLRALGPRLDPAQARYLEAALIDPRSLNLRNRAAHGLDPQPPNYQFVVLFHIACLLMCISYASTSDTGRPEQ